jgi:hypothetical protein
MSEPTPKEAYQERHKAWKEREANRKQKAAADRETRLAAKVSRAEENKRRFQMQSADEMRVFDKETGEWVPLSQAKSKRQVESAGEPETNTVDVDNQATDEPQTKSAIPTIDDALDKLRRSIQ